MIGFASLYLTTSFLTIYYARKKRIKEERAQAEQRAQTSAARKRHGKPAGAIPSASHKHI